MARLAGCARLGVYTVTEVNVRREAVNADPTDRLLLVGSGSELLNVRTIWLVGLMAGHAKTLGRKPHELTGVGVLVTRVALQPQGQVRFVAEGKRLLLAIQSSGHQQ
jgi:hypothetical protein